MAVKRNYRINLRNYGNPPAIQLSQYDTGYALVFEVYDGPSPSTTLAPYTVKLIGTRADNLGYEFTGTVGGTANNVLSFTIDNTISAVAGRGTAEIQIIDSQNDILFASFNMSVFVEKAAKPNSVIDADVEAEQTLAEQIEAMIDEATGAVTQANDAKDAAETAQGKAEDAQEAAETAQGKAEDAQEAAETAKDSAETNALKAEGYAVGKQSGTDVASDSDYYQNNAKYYKEQAASSATSASGSATAAAGSATAAASHTAPTYSSSATYAVGDYCVYNSQLYRCTTAITTAEAWTAAHWTAVTVGDEISSLKEDLNTIDYETELMTQSMPEEFYADESTAFSWHQGAIGTSGVIDPNTQLRIYSDKLPLGSGIIGTHSSTTNQYWVRVYGENDAFLGSGSTNSDGDFTTSTWATSYGINVDTVLNNYATAKYIRLSMKNVDNSVIGVDDSAFTWTQKAFVGGELDNIYVRKSNGQYSSETIRIAYDIGNGYIDKGWLKLPPNYTPLGDSVPLIVCIHGSSDYSSIDSGVSQAYEEYYNYLRDCGYAVFDCYGFGNKYTTATGGFANTWGVPINRACYNSGIRYICDKYNVDENNVFVTCKSLGGLQAEAMYFDESININAVGMLAPQLSILKNGLNMGYEAVTKKMIASELGFSEDVNGVLNFGSGDVIPEGFWDYITENIDKWSGNFSFFNGLPISTSDKPNYYRSPAQGATKTMVRNSNTNRPVKIWVAEDDDTYLRDECIAFIQSLNNGGFRGTLRLMPAGTGGHHAVDNSPLALQQTDVTTKLGVHYDSVPLAYYELAQWFDKWMIE